MLYVCNNRAADLSEEVTKRRAARYLGPDTGVRPYSRLQAEGYKMLSELEKVCIEIIICIEYIKTTEK